jgi:hypothetical protein
MAELLFQIPLENSSDCLWITLTSDQYFLKFPKNLRNAVTKAFDEAIAFDYDETHGQIFNEGNRYNLSVLLNFLQNKFPQQQNNIFYTNEKLDRTSKPFSFLLNVISQKITDISPVADVSWFYGQGKGKMAVVLPLPQGKQMRPFGFN